MELNHFKEYFKYLDENDIVINNGTHNFCYWGEKQNLDVTYLGYNNLGEKWIEYLYSI